MASLYSFALPKPTSSFIIKSSTSTTTTTIASPPPSPTATSTESLQDRFGRKGIKFSESSNGISFAELTVRNGSSLKLQIPNAHVTSYKPKVYWKDDGCEELLYAVPGSGGASSYKFRGGIGLILNDEKGATPIAMSEWIVENVDSDAIDALQVELSCKSGSLDINYVVSLYPVSMATAVKVQNNGRKPVKLTSAILTHFLSKRRNGAAIQGLQGCSYCSQPPLSSSFELLSPSEAVKTESPRWFFGPEPEKKVGEWTSQEVPFTILGNKLSRVYGVHPAEISKPFHRTTPSKYEYIDQGRELFFRIIRMGYEDIYLSGPGSYAEKFGKDYFICTGPASMLVPVVVNPEEEWRGAQVIEHDNL